MQLIDEEDDVFILLQLLQNALDALLELAAILCACNHAGQVKRDELLVLEVIRYVARRDLLRQTLGNCGLADARVANQCRVILGTAGQNLDDAVDLVLATNDRVELTVTRSLG